MNAMVWFSKDLRVHDNEALFHALHNHERVIGVVNIHDLNKKTSFGFEKMAWPKRHFLHETLLDLEASLAELNVPLIVKNTETKALLNTVIKRYDISDIYYHYEVGEEERNIRTTLKKYGPNHHHVYFTKSLIHPKDLSFPIESMPHVFTHFRKTVEKDLTIRPVFKTPPKRLEKLPLLKDDARWPDFSLCEDKTIPFKGGEQAGLKRLKYYIKSRAIDQYKTTRNNMVAFDASTKFSPYLAMGALSPRMVYKTIKDYEDIHGANESTYFVIFELLWRDFFTFIHMKYGNAIFKSGGIMNQSLPWVRNHAHFKAWCDGLTGYPLVDAAMRELKTTGFMSNRARQNVASFLTKNLAIDWRMGAEWFESFLIDHDSSSNYGNWNYIAGIGNDRREFRYFNVMTQGKRYDPKGEFVHCFVEELRSIDGTMVYDIPTLGSAFVNGLAPNYVSPIVSFHESIQARKKMLNH